VKALFALVILVVGFAIYAYPRLWLRAGTAEARSHRGTVYEANIYKSTRGDLLFVIRQDSLVDEYIFYPTTGQIGIPSISQFQVFSFLAYSWETPVPVVLSTDKIKVEMDMNIVVDQKYIEFTTLRNLRVKVDTSNF
jgi:hypothetical protein